MVHLVLRVPDTGAFERKCKGPPADLPVRGMAPIDERIDHRMLEMRSPPPRHQRLWPAAPAFGLQVRREGIRQPALYIDDRAVEIEGQESNGRFELGSTASTYGNGQLSSFSMRMACSLHPDSAHRAENRVRFTSPITLHSVSVNDTAKPNAPLNVSTALWWSRQADGDRVRIAGLGSVHGWWASARRSVTTMSKSTSTSSFTRTAPPAKVSGTIPYSLCFT